MIEPFLIALQFLTRLPVPITAIPDEKSAAQSLSYYPLVGLIIGAILAGFAWALKDISELLTAGLLLTIWILLTGGLHIDGLADSADAWVGGLGDREKTLAIMKDPYCGPAGVLSIVLLLILKLTALYTILDSSFLIPIILAPLLGRAIILPLFMTTPYVRTNGLGAAISAHLPRKIITIVFSFTLLGTVVLAGLNGLWFILITMLGLVCLRFFGIQRIGGMTGDVAGALVEITEASVLILAALIY